jgi:hypothetical protein
MEVWFVKKKGLLLPGSQNVIWHRDKTKGVSAKRIRAEATHKKVVMGLFFAEGWGF